MWGLAGVRGDFLTLRGGWEGMNQTLQNALSSLGRHSVVLSTQNVDKGRWIGELGSMAFCSVGQRIPTKVKGRCSGPGLPV